MLAEAAHNAGVITEDEYAAFQNSGYMGLYGGLKVSDIHRRKGLDKNEKILDRMGSEELAANLFRITQTESKLKRDNVQGIDDALATHFFVGSKVRDGVCLTANILESRSSGEGCMLSDILMSDVPEKYFLSKAAMRKILSSLSGDAKDKESMKPAE